VQVYDGFLLSWLVNVIGIAVLAGMVIGSEHGASFANAAVRAVQALDSFCFVFWC